MFLISLVGVYAFKPAFYKMGFIISKKSINVKFNHIKVDIGKGILKEDTKIKIINENLFLFCSDNKNKFDDIITRRIVPHIIFGDCNIINNNATIKYKIPIFIILLILIFIFFIIHESYINSASSVPAIIFILLMIIILAFFQYLKLKNMKNDIEYYLTNGM
jgi:hypothetical protein